jgi:FAD/FMN-containing dehydrogenase
MRLLLRGGRVRVRVRGRSRLRRLRRGLLPAQRGPAAGRGQALAQRVRLRRQPLLLREGFLRARGRLGVITRVRRKARAASVQLLAQAELSDVA